MYKRQQYQLPYSSCTLFRQISQGSFIAFAFLCSPGFGLGRFGGAVAMQNKIIEQNEEFSYFYMDNYYLKTLVEMGYVGLIAFIILLVGMSLWCLRSIGRTRLCETDRTRVLAVSLFSGMCGVMVHCYFENIFEVPYMMAYFWSMAAAVLYLGYFRKKRKA